MTTTWRLTFVKERESDRKSFGSKATVSQSCVRIGCQRIRRIVSFHFSGHVSQMLWYKIIPVKRIDDLSTAFFNNTWHHFRGSNERLCHLAESASGGDKEKNKIQIWIVKDRRQSDFGSGRRWQSFFSPPSPPSASSVTSTTSTTARVPRTVFVQKFYRRLWRAKMRSAKNHWRINSHQLFNSLI